MEREKRGEQMDEMEREVCTSFATEIGRVRAIPRIDVDNDMHNSTRLFLFPCTTRSTHIFYLSLLYMSPEVALQPSKQMIIN